ncbi:hypothetical protein Psal006b_01557 [Piscirickettsia salmonis]|uniref:Uncharacterized protein n=1 Tax=Piscirickettsia salmonis TaxID=1238 RepID=A0AAC8ZP18_PISSA|nr:hypothetical protein KU39_1650 [Piscirickettsia salmonis]ALT18414.1 hypothetical protein PSLF89_05915 [Piscirickettsia salmonis LF-89 = ATCC VR-1361]ALY02811.1 hypothetical protein AWE47_08065 [Piscirickettsia salmonis]AMA42366.1 hypothetical protein AWJ11_08280 [Piscirickettsia salmonis]AOS34834.1 hypothetical protein AVM72_05415 [Piscirickettsia salmonis]
MPGDKKKSCQNKYKRESKPLIRSEASSLPSSLLFYTDSLSLVNQGQYIPIDSKKESSCPTCCLVM